MPIFSHESTFLNEGGILDKMWIFGRVCVVKVQVELLFMSAKLSV